MYVKRKIIKHLSAQICYQMPSNGGEEEEEEKKAMACKKLVI